MVQLRGITITTIGNAKTIRLLTRSERGDDYTTLIYPDTLKLNEGQVRKFLGDHFGIDPGKIIWPAHIKIPEV